MGKLAAVVLTALSLLAGLSMLCTKNPSSASRPEGKSDRGYFVIASPTEKDSIKTDSTLSILWVATSKVKDTAKIRITLYKDSVEIATLAASTANNGAFTCAVSSIGSGKNYRIKICALADSAKYDFSGSFEIYSIFSGSIKIIYPTFRNRLVIDGSDTVRWETTGNPGPRLRLDLYCDTTFVSSIVQGMYTTLGKYPWMLISSPLGTRSRYRIKVASENDVGIYSYSDYFTISSKYYGGYNITLPAPAHRYPSGQTCTILWDTVGSPGPTAILQLCIDTTVFASIAAAVPNSGKYGWSVPFGLTTDSGYVIKITSIQDAGIVGFSKPFTISGIASDRFEPDNNRAKANTLALGSIEDHSLPLNDTDWVRFSASAGSSYIIMSKGLNQFQILCALYPDTIKEPIAFSAASASGALLWMWACVKSGSYDARIIPAPGLSAGEYSIAILEFDSLSSVHFTAPIASSTLYGGSNTTIAWAPDSLLLGDSVSISLYKGSTRLSVLAAKVPSKTGSFSWVVSDSSLSGADYRIRIGNAAQPSLCGYSPAFIISDVGPDAFESDGTPKTASQLKLYSLQQHTISYNDTDYIQFPADSGVAYLISLLGESQFRTNAMICADSSSTSCFTLVSYANGQYNYVWPCAKSENYIAKITAYSWQTGAYSFKIGVFNPDTIVGFVSPAQGAAWEVDSTDTIRWNPTIDLFGATVALELFSGQSRTYSISASLQNSGSFAWKIPSGIGSGIAYRIKLSSLSNTGFYGMSPVFSIKGKPGDSYEPDNSWNLAHAYTLGTMENHNITYNDTDWIKFSADSGSSYFLRLNGAESFRTTIAFYYENNWNGYDPFVSNASGEIKTLWRCNKTGIAYARINASLATLSSFGAYSVILIKLDSLKSVAFTSPVAGARFNAGDSILVQWTPDTNFLGQQVDVTLYKGNKAIFSNSWVNNTGKTQLTLPKNSTISGNDYRIKIARKQNDEYFGYSPSFSISGIDVVPDGYEVDNTAGAARVIAPGSVQQHNLIFDDTDWVQISIPAGSQYVLLGDRTSGSDISVMVRYGSSTASVESYQFSNNSNNFRAITPSTAGSPCFMGFMAGPSNIYTVYTCMVALYDSSNAIRITSPIAGQVVTSGKATTISWVAPENIFGQYVTLNLYDGATSITTLTSNNTGSLSWNASGVVSGSNYHFTITGSNPNMPTASGPVFTVVGAGVDSYEPDNTPEQGSVLQLGTVQKRNLVLNDVDWIKINAEAGYKYLFEYVMDQSLEITASLKDGSMLSQQYSSLHYDNCVRDTTISLWTCATSGTCYLQIVPMSSSSNVGNYSVKVTRFDTTVNAKILSPIAGSILTAGIPNTVTWTPDTSLFGKRIYINLYKGTMSVTSAYDVQNTGAYSWNIPTFVENGNDYRICISRYNAYNVSGNLSPNFTITGGLTADAYEPDNKQGQAALLPLEIVQRHTIPRGDTDWVKIQVDSGVTYIFTDSTTSTGLVMVLTAASGSFIKWLQIEAGQTATEWACEQTGTYYRQISIEDSMFGIRSPGIYSMKLSKK
jgi:hypothetical protein